jgi:hypothetical protein
VTSRHIRDSTARLVPLGLADLGIAYQYHVSRLVAGVLEAESAVLGVYVMSKERKEERSGELELSTGCHARARSCDADVTTHITAS